MPDKWLPKTLQELREAPPNTRLALLMRTAVSKVFVTEYLTFGCLQNFSSNRPSRRDKLGNLEIHYTECPDTLQGYRRSDNLLYMTYSLDSLRFVRDDHQMSAMGWVKLDFDEFERQGAVERGWPTRR